MAPIAYAIDRLISTGFARPRGILFDPVQTHRMYEAAREKYGAPLTGLAAEKLKQTVSRGDVVVFLTGTYHPVQWPKGEVDGPPGAAALARAIDVGLGAKPIILCEEQITGVISETCIGGGLVPLPFKLFKQRNHSVAIESFPALGPQETIQEAKARLERYNPSAVISIERLGRNHKGVYHSAMGFSKDPQYMARVDHLVDEARARGITTIGVGDGGNEIGFGSVAEEMKGIVAFGDKCQCPCGEGLISDVETDVIIPSAASNWGAYGIEAALAVLLGDERVMHDGEMEKRTLHKCADTGCADGTTTMATPTTDGTPELAAIYVVELLKMTVTESLRTVERDF